MTVTSVFRRTMPVYVGNNTIKASMRFKNNVLTVN